MRFSSLTPAALLTALALVAGGCTGKAPSDTAAVAPASSAGSAAAPAPVASAPSVSGAKAAAGRTSAHGDLHANDAVGGASEAPQLPAGHPPLGGSGMATPANVETDGDPQLPVKKTGINSREELDRGLKAATTEASRNHFELGFRYAFTTRPELRQYALAESELRQAIEIDPGLPEAYRALGYAVFNKAMSFDEAIPLYRKAVELKPDYGEAHYALAFILAPKARDEGREHFRKAMALGIPDERQLGPRFYPTVQVEQK